MYYKIQLAPVFGDNGNTLLLLKLNSNCLFKPKGACRSKSKLTLAQAFHYLKPISSYQKANTVLGTMNALPTVGNHCVILFFLFIDLNIQTL